MRVLHVYRTYFPDSQGGLEEVIRQICLNTQSSNVESRVLSLSPSPDPAVVNLPEAQVFRAKLTFEIASCGMSLSALSLFRDLVEWADLVHYHFPWPFADFLHFYAKVSKPTLVTYHSDIVRQRALNAFYTPLMKRFLRSVDRIVCTSPNYFVTSKILPSFEDKTEIIPIGITESPNLEPSRGLLDSTKKKYGENFFLFVGVLRYYKGLHILLEAIKDASFSVVIVGSGPTEGELQTQAKALGLNNLIFTGYLPDEEKIALLKLCKCIVFPSYMRSEAFGVTLLEGAMHGKPLISTEIGSGTTHVNVDGQTGLIVPPAAPKALRKAMDQIWDRPEMATLMGKRARERYKRLFTGELMGTRYAHLYSKLTNGSNSSDPVIKFCKEG